MSSARESKEGSILTGHMETYNNSLERVAQKGYSDLVPHHLFLQHYDFFEHLTELESILGGNIPTVQRIKCLEAVLSISATPGASLHECIYATSMSRYAVDSLRKWRYGNVVNKQIPVLVEPAEPKKYLSAIGQQSVSDHNDALHIVEFICQPS